MSVSLQILYALELANRPRTPTEIVEDNPRIKSGSVYVLLNRLESNGFVTSKRDAMSIGPGRPRVRYAITDKGYEAMISMAVDEVFAACEVAS